MKGSLLAGVVKGLPYHVSTRRVPKKMHVRLTTVPLPSRQVLDAARD